MKKLFLTVSLLALCACSPEDNKLNPVNNNTNVQGQSGKNGLRVGSYGIPIVVGQNLEMAGALMKRCLALQSQSRVQKITNADGLEVLSWSCHHELEIEGSGSGFLSESWNVTIEAKPENQQPVRATGRLLGGFVASQFKRESVTFEYRSKKFEIEFKDAKSFELSSTSLADLKSSKDTLNIHSKIRALGEVRESGITSIWAFTDVTSSFQVINRNQRFNLKSSNLQLNWSKPFCAELQGKMSTLETGSRNPESIITLTPTQAHLLVQGSQRPWSQKYMGCEKRTGPVHNFEFLLY